ncbi:MAG: hypothetical protein RL026_1890 [Pseudomonadota bacterium]
MTLVLDASVALAWGLEDEGPGHDYAQRVLSGLAQQGAVAWVPSLWGLEVGNVLARGEARGTVPAARLEALLRVLDHLPLRIDEQTAERALRETLVLARQRRLSTYDASSLELAARKGLPIATLDAALAAAADACGVARV